MAGYSEKLIMEKTLIAAFVGTAGELHAECERVLGERHLEVVSDDATVEFEVFIEHDFTDHD
jgi:hypothetical protein